nr:hypothetical protein [Microbacterium protaetiae]
MELIVYIVVLGIVMSVITMLFINTWKAQASVTSQTQATTRGQLVSSEIERAMRNAVDFKVLDSGATLEVNTSFTGDRQCQGFALTGAGLSMTISSNTTEPAIGTWPVWQERVESVSGVPLFTELDTTGVAYAFDATSDSAPVRFTGDTYTRNQTLGTMGGCWE